MATETAQCLLKLLSPTSCTVSCITEHCVNLLEQRLVMVKIVVCTLTRKKMAIGNTLYLKLTCLYFFRFSNVQFVSYLILKKSSPKASHGVYCCRSISVRTPEIHVLQNMKFDIKHNGNW